MMTKIIRPDFKKKPGRLAFHRLPPHFHAELMRLMKIIELIGFDRLTIYEYEHYKILIDYIDTSKDKENCTKAKGEKIEKGTGKKRI